MAAALDNGGTGRLYLGVDVGGTKILAALAKASGRILARFRRATPRRGARADTVAAVADAVDGALAKGGVDPGAVGAAGLAVPGVVDADGEVAFSPNTNLAGARIAGDLRRRFGFPVAIGNDVNCGALGEAWLGSAGWADSAVGVFVGTGIGGGIIVDGRLLRGRRGAAGEIGHMLVAPGGPVCGCGATGCLEAVASRTAIERDIRQALADGRATVLAELPGARRKPIKSGLLRKALQRGDAVVAEVMTRAAEALGRACVSLRHLLDPDVIVLGGGVIEACEDFVMPVVERAAAADTLTGPGPAAKIVVSALGDDAVVLGAVAMAQRAAGRDPIERAMRGAEYPVLSVAGRDAVAVGGKTAGADVCVRADGKVKKRRKLLDGLGAEPETIGRAELEQVCRFGPALLVVAAPEGSLPVTEEGRTFLRRRGIELQVLPAGAAAEAFNSAPTRKAAIVHVEV